MAAAMGKNSKVIKTIVYTALFIALLVVLQFLIGKLGVQLLTGSIVNFVLVAAVLIGGPVCGTVTAAASPVIAYFTGVAVLKSPLMLPAVAIGNIVLVLVYWLVFKIALPKVKKLSLYNWIIAVPLAAAAKFGVLYLAMVKITLPLLGLPDKAQAAISTAFGVTQLFTALIGGVIALIVVPTLQYAIGKSKK